MRWQNKENTKVEQNSICVTERFDMARTNRKFSVARRNDEDSYSRFNEDAPFSSDATGESLDDLIAGLTFQPDVELEKSVRAGIPSVDEFHSDDAAARRLASKLAPNRKPRIKMRRPRIRSRVNDNRRLFPEEQADRVKWSDVPHAENRDASRQAKVPPRKRRRLFWGVSTSILLVASISAVLGLVGPLNGFLPIRTDDFSGKSSAGIGDRTDRPAKAEVVRNHVGSDSEPALSDKSTASTLLPAIPAVPVTPASAAAPIPPAPPGEKTDSGDDAKSLAAAGEQALGSSGNSLDLATSSGTEDNFTITGSLPVKSEDRLQSPEARRFDPEEPETSTSPPTTEGESVSSVAQPAEFSLSAAQIDHLLAQGEGLLRDGNIVPARLVFMRVAAAGDRRGARGVGMTYDPEVYARLPVSGLSPDREQAELWYEKAGEDSTFMTIGQNAADKPVQPVANSEERNAACARKYRSFDANTGLYKSYSGVMRPCRLP